MTGRIPIPDTQAACGDGVPEIAAEPASPHQTALRRRPRLALLRLALLALSTAGVMSAFLLLARGRPDLAARVLAGDILLVFGILMLA